jgi:hypothetical protein
LPVYIPVSLKPGHVRTQEFTVNLNKLYTISIEAKKRLPFDTLNCLLGVSADPGNVLGKTCNEQEVIKANWVLTSNSKVVAKDTSESIPAWVSWSGTTAERQIGKFEGESGRRYVLDVEFLTDGSALAVTDPHLKVEVTNAFYEDVMWGSIYWVFPWEALALLGLVLLAAAGVRAWRHRHVTYSDLETK